MRYCACAPASQLALKKIPNLRHRRSYISEDVTCSTRVALQHEVWNMAIDELQMHAYSITARKSTAAQRLSGWFYDRGTAVC